MDHVDRQVRRRATIHLHLATVSRRTPASVIDGVTAHSERTNDPRWYSVVHEQAGTPAIWSTHLVITFQSTIY